MSYPPRISTDYNMMININVWEQKCRVRRKQIGVRQNRKKNFNNKGKNKDY
jgi:hypothetical protein